MRIGGYNSISHVYGANKTNKAKNVNATGYASFKDEVSFSSIGKDMQIAKSALATVPDVRESKVNDIKSRIDNGTYKVSSADFADKLISAFETKKAY